ncbi:MAG: YaaR family protein [Bacillota bacterium]
MKISSLGNRENFPVNPADKIGKGEGETVEFGKTLGVAKQKEYHKDMQRLIDEVDKMAKRLGQSCTLSDLKNYKRAVQSFLKRTLGDAYEAQEQNSWDRMGRQKLFVLVKKVDESLEELSKQVLSQHKDSLDILGKLDEIRGLLVDMYL